MKKYPITQTVTKLVYPQNDLPTMKRGGFPDFPNIKAEDGLVRIQKYIADCGLLSRRAAEEAIRTGKVTVNGSIAEIGQKIDPVCDIVALGGVPVKRRTEDCRYILLNKPRGYLSSASDDRGRKCVTDIVKIGTRIYPVGRLDMDSEGLLILTNDGDLTYKLTHPKHEIPKIYRVTVKGEVTDLRLAELGCSMNIDGYDIQPVETTLLEKSDDSSVLQMILYEGRNRQIRKMCEAVNLKVARLCRIAIGDIKLENLEIGTWRDLTAEEIAYLKNERKQENA